MLSKLASLFITFMCSIGMYSPEATKRNVMHWKEHLDRLEQEKQWDEAIAFMQQFIQENPNNMDAYMFMNYLIMNFIVEEDCDWNDQPTVKRYATLAKWYFDESYAKFSNNAEYLYITAKTAVMSEWFFGIDVTDYYRMFAKAHELEPDNIMYQEQYWYNVSDKNPADKALIAHAKLVLSDNSPIKIQLKDKGAVGRYILMLRRGWAEDVLSNAKRAKIEKSTHS
ncbi:MAG: hypothetical protein WCE21_03235 [Candidatus Babeliales bacterium]